MGLNLRFEQAAALRAQVEFGVAHQPHPLDVGVRNNYPAVWAEMTRLTGLPARSGGWIIRPSSNRRTLAVNFMDGHGPRRMGQAELEIADPEGVPRPKLGTGQTPQVGWGRDILVRWEAKQPLAPERQQAVMGLDRRVAQDQVVIFIATDADDWPVVLEIDGAEDSCMVNELKHWALRWNGFPPATLEPRPGRPARIS